MVPPLPLSAKVITYFYNDSESLFLPFFALEIHSISFPIEVEIKDG